MEKARAREVREYMQEQRLKDPGSIFLDRAAKETLVDLLDAIDAWFTALDSADDCSYDNPLSLAVEAMKMTVRRHVKGVQESGVLDAALIDTTHPRFASVLAAIRAGFSVDCAIEEQPAAGQNGPRLIK